MKLLISNRAAVLAMFVAMPFVIGGTLFCTRGFDDTFAPHILVNMTVGYGMFLLGAPLTLLGYAIISYFENSVGTRLNAVCFTSLLSLLFIIQWTMWSQLIALIWQRIERRKGLS